MNTRYSWMKNWSIAPAHRVVLISCIFLIFYSIYFIWWWFFKLDVSPGLHADEAWFGLKAHYYSQHDLDRLQGMNQYTGILQILLAKFTFEAAGMSLFNLRIGGVVLNLIALGIICYQLIVCKFYYWSLFFLVIIGQSALYLTSPRVAWEVNTFTLFFLSLVFLSMWKIYNHPDKFNRLWVVVFLLTGILAGYNHLIFSSVSLAGFSGLALWGIYYKSSKYNTLMILFGICLVNHLVFFLVLLYLQHITLLVLWLLLLGVLLLLYLECIIYSRLQNISFSVFSFSRQNSAKWVIILLLTAGMVGFVGIHGSAFFEVLSGYKIFLQNYSYESSFLLQYLFITAAIGFTFCLVRYLCLDLMSKNLTPMPFFILTYCGVLNLYTLNTSFRYYLILYAIIALYMAYKASLDRYGRIWLLGALLLSFCLMNVVQLDLRTTINNRVRAVKFTIGNNQQETSAHFLPKEPLIDFLRVNNAGKVHILNADAYFVLTPVEFYSLVKPWQIDSLTKAVVEYNFKTYSDGYILYIEN